MHPPTTLLHDCLNTHYRLTETQYCHSVAMGHLYGTIALRGEGGGLIPPLGCTVPLQLVDQE